MDNTSEKSYLHQIRQWIFESFDNTLSDHGLNMKQIMKFLDQKRDGLSESPVVKIILKKSIDNNNLIDVGNGCFKVNEAKSGRRRRVGRRRTIKRGRRRSGRQPTTPQPKPTRRRRRRSKKKSKKTTRRRRRRTKP